MYRAKLIVQLVTNEIIECLEKVDSLVLTNVS